METNVRYLVDTNIWLERLLDQDKSYVVSKFLDLVPAIQIFISDFTVHSIRSDFDQTKEIGYSGQNHDRLIY